jgi:hypothetical protein
LETANSAAWSALLTSALQIVGGFAERIATSLAHRWLRALSSLQALLRRFWRVPGPVDGHVED